jgi:hypothetical protein
MPEASTMNAKDRADFLNYSLHFQAIACQLVGRGSPHPPSVNEVAPGAFAVAMDVSGKNGPEEGLQGNGSPVHVILTGPDRDALESMARQIALMPHMIALFLAAGPLFVLAASKAPIANSNARRMAMLSELVASGLVGASWPADGPAPERAHANASGATLSEG